MAITHEVAKAPAQGETIMYMYREKSSGLLSMGRGVYCALHKPIIKQAGQIGDEGDEWITTGTEIGFHHCIMWFILTGEA